MFPFSPEAERFAAARRAEALRLGRQRISQARPSPLATQEDLLAFIGARHIAKWAGLIRKRAVVEAKTFRRQISGKPEEVFAFLEAAGIRLGQGIHWRDYLRFAPREPAYFLENQRISKGEVFLPPQRLERFAEEVFRRLYEADFPAWPEANLLPKTSPKKIPKGQAHPPCIQALLEKAGKGIHIPHMGRWFLAVYFLARGRPVDEIVALFRNMPDFKEEKSRYYVEHAKKRGYSVPSCVKVKSYGLCPGDCGRKHPLSKAVHS